MFALYFRIKDYYQNFILEILLLDEIWIQIINKIYSGLWPPLVQKENLPPLTITFGIQIPE